MKKIEIILKALVIIILLLSSAFLFSQVGIGTTNPQAQLHIQGNLPLPTLIVEDIQPSTADRYLVIDPTSHEVGYRTTLPSSGGYQRIIDEMGSAYFVSAPAGNYIDSWDVGQSITVNLADGMNHIITVYYEMPMGSLSSASEEDLVYLGVEFYKNGVLQDQPTGKQSMAVNHNIGGTGIYSMYKLVGNFFDSLNNTTGSSVSYTYSLRAYIEQYAAANPKQYVFGMWDGAGNNYNWGKGTLVVEVNSY